MQGARQGLQGTADDAQPEEPTNPLRKLVSAAQGAVQRVRPSAQDTADDLEAAVDTRDIQPAQQTAEGAVDSVQGVVDGVVDGVTSAVDGARDGLINAVETGVVQPLSEIGETCRAKNIYFHTDCAQAVGKIPINVNKLNIDLMSFSGHKFYAPMGIGVLYVRRRPRVRLVNQMDGGGQERGLRSGTLPLPLCVGLGKAAEIASAEMVEEMSWISQLRERFLLSIRDKIPEVRVNGSMEKRIPGNLNLQFEDINVETLLSEVRGVAISSGAACTSASEGISHVLVAMGLTENQIKSSLRIGFGRFTTKEDVDRAAKIISVSIQNQRVSVSNLRERFG